DHLMLRKQSPLHPVEVALFKAALQAKNDGLDGLIAGTGADCTFGGLDRLLSRDWTVDEFIDRYTFVKPELAVREPMSMRAIYSRYENQGKMDVPRFLAFVHGPGLVQAFQNGIVSAGCDWIAPYEMLRLNCPLNIDRIRAGESKYLLREVFCKVHPELEIPPKIAFARPMDTWMKYWAGPKRPEFLSDLDVSAFTGEQKWLIYCLERFMNLFDDVSPNEPATNSNEFGASPLVCNN
ncbi:MAG: asparagine synthase C-terminal domain-containing protein, partial [Armatimonadetes bacterium]|nr:asparagine synthase C-terminal domain-containing protein [Armatimonadota bacterium]